MKLNSENKQNLSNQNISQLIQTGVKSSQESYDLISHIEIRLKEGELVNEGNILEIFSKLTQKGLDNNQYYHLKNLFSVLWNYYFLQVFKGSITSKLDNNIEVYSNPIQEHKLFYPAIDNAGNTLLHYILLNSKKQDINKSIKQIEDIIKLYAAEVDSESGKSLINQQNNDGDTILHIAATRGLPKIARILLNQNNVDPNIHNNNGDTPLHIAAKANNSAIVNELLKSKAKVIVYNQESRLPNNCFIDEEEDKDLEGPNFWRIKFKHQQLNQRTAYSNRFQTGLKFGATLSTAFGVGGSYFILHPLILGSTLIMGCTVGVLAALLVVAVICTSLAIYDSKTENLSSGRWRGKVEVKKADIAQATEKTV